MYEISLNGYRGETSCMNGSCIPSELLCDGNNDCPTNILGTSIDESQCDFNNTNVTQCDRKFKQ